GTCPCLVGVALPSGNGGRFYFQPSGQKNGVCVMPGAHWKQLLKAADEALYRAKRSGKDKVVPF
ncbi:MAG: diguanylate cyclase, partial [Deltaproteobacteria bacterium]|nr:diguanylate cyclase [Deltaproteobacteria bacterium]